MAVAGVSGREPLYDFTEPPPRFSEASLVKELERLGIGRPSTYAQITSTLVARHYASLAEKRFRPTELGETVEKLLIPRVPDIFDVQFTSRMETELDKIEDGELGRLEVLNDFWGPFEKRLASVKPEEMVGEVHDLSKIADLPSFNALRSQLLSLFTSNAAAFVRVLDAKVKKEQPAAPAA